ncbi:hypothetical protein [Magnetospirillum sp. 15-1]|uniref:hypothetical protein n=1 Tax=Magnetospirillum sp. 15-1 TaxID=1979370 RepID=UPI0011415194|nr:hypothetical protein [Magnetospirillum sp. 15-1]
MSDICAIPSHPRPVSIVLVPIAGMVSARPDLGHFTALEEVRLCMAGMPIKDADIRFYNMRDHGSRITLEFSGTAIGYTSIGMAPGIEMVAQAPIEVSTGDVVGIADRAALKLGPVITMVDPDGDVLQMTTNSYEINF